MAWWTVMPPSMSAWEMDDVDAVGRAAAAMVAADPARHVWGLGRHGIGSNYFWYLRDPAGNFAEYSSDLDVIADDEAWRVAASSGAHPLAAWGPRIAGGTYTPSDESGDARVFTQELAKRCAARGARFLYEHDIVSIEKAGGEVSQVTVAEQRSGKKLALKADAYVAALGSYTAPLLRPLGVSLNIYPAKGYSATLRLKQPERASVVSI